MAEMWFFNSIAKRRRSSGDTFLENGLAALRGHLEGEGHTIRVIDWATEEAYAQLTPRWLARLNRTITAGILALRKNSAGAASAGLSFKLLFVLSLVTQRLEDFVLARRMCGRLKRLAREVRDAGVRIFGIKVWYGEAFEWAERLCRYVHEYSPETVVVAGGHQPTLYEQEFLKRTSFDLAVVSQGELPAAYLLDLTDEMEAAGTFSREGFVETAIDHAERGYLKNLMYRKDGDVRLTKRYGRLNGGAYFPSYDWDREEKVGIHVVIESLGCTWGKCNFCVHRHFYDGFRPRDVEDIIREIRYMRDKGVGIFRFAGSDTPPAFGKNIGEALLREGMEIEFGMGSRAVKGIRDPAVYEEAVEAYRVLIRAGLRAVFMGGECGDPWVNDEVMNKGLDPEEVVLTAKALREAERCEGKHVDLSLALIYPVPTMGMVTQEEVFDADLDLVERVGPDSVMVTPPGPFRNTEWNRNAAKYGFDLDADWVDSIIRYEYVLYKPPFLWEKIPIRFEGQPYTKVLELCGRMRRAIEEDLGIPTDLSDEHFLMLRAAGYEGVEGAKEFKETTVLDLVSGDYGNIRSIAGRVNMRSRQLAYRSRKPSRVTVGEALSSRAILAEKAMTVRASVPGLFS